MARPIEPLPTLRVKDIEKFEREIRETKPSEETKKFLEECKAVYKKYSAKQ